jgi:hypothetical protein
MATNTRSGNWDATGARTSLHTVASTTNPGRAMSRRVDATFRRATGFATPRRAMSYRLDATSRRATAGATAPRRAMAPGGASRPIFHAQPLALEEILRRDCQPFGSENPLGRVHDCGNCCTSLMRGKSISLGNELLDFGDLHGFGLLGVLDAGDPLVVVVSNPSKAIAQTIDRVSAFIKGVGFNLILLG